MTRRTTNPFNVTKATDFSDPQIHELWVELSAQARFAEVAKPTSPMPMFILGGKGSGKTHLMRHFSWPIQKLRHQSDGFAAATQDGYIGVYCWTGDVHAGRFEGKQQSLEVWNDVFAYYLELWLAQLLLETARDSLGAALSTEVEARIVADALRLFDVAPSDVRSLEQLFNVLGDWRHAADDAINNSAISRTLKIRIKVTSGKLVFGLPRVIAKHVSKIGGARFVYLIDELESLTEAQQTHINTLVRERQEPTSFKIGARLYGVKTHRTSAAGEDNKEGSEFEVFRLDTMFRENKGYADFAARLCQQRLDAAGNTGPAGEARDFSDWFAPDEPLEVLLRHSDGDRPHLVALRKKVAQGVEAGVAPGIQRVSEIEAIVDRLRCPSPLLEKVNVFMLFKHWYAGTSLADASRQIEHEVASYQRSPKERSDYKQVLDHFRSDMVAQLLRDNSQKQRYVGMPVFVEMSDGLPRNLLVILKHIFKWATFNGEEPFVAGQLSVDAQQRGVRDASEWFFHDARQGSTDGEYVRDAVKRLGDLMRDIRFSDKPSECSLSAFSADLTMATPIARRTLDVAEQWSLIVPTKGGQRDRNRRGIQAKYHINHMLSPRWDLPVAVRGAIALSSDEVNAIFDPEHASEFETVRRRRVDRMMAPFFGKRRRLKGQSSLPGFGDD